MSSHLEVQHQIVRLRVCHVEGDHNREADHQKIVPNINEIHPARALQASDALKTYATQCQGQL